MLAAQCPLLVCTSPPLLDASQYAGAAAENAGSTLCGGACSGAGGGRDLATERAVAASLRDIQDYEERARRQAQAGSSAAAAAGARQRPTAPTASRPTRRAPRLREFPFPGFGVSGPAMPQGTTLA